VPIGLVLSLIGGSVLVVVLPRPLAAVPILLVATYTTRIPVVVLGPANLSVLRVVILVGLARVLFRGERIANGLNSIDRWVIAWATFLVAVSLFHTSDAWTYRLGMMLGELGVYFLCRVFIRDAKELHGLFAVLCFALLPLAILMIMEKYTSHNYFAIMGAGDVVIREGHVRASGPLAHPILAGTVGATAFPMAYSLWRTNRPAALAGLCAAAGIVFASTSSGPIMMSLFTCVGLVLWRVRASLRSIRWATFAGIIGLQLVMKDPVYFLMARIDITGGSTGWHRAQLIRSAIEHLDEWWAFGTDYTRHWMATGIYANEIHTDITNHFLAMGVLGGLPLMTLFIMVLRAGFRSVGFTLRDEEGRSPERDFLAWILGAMLFGQVMNFWSISLFDQSVSFLYLILVGIGAVSPIMAVERNLSLRPADAALQPSASGTVIPTVTTESTGVFTGARQRGYPNDRQPIFRTKCVVPPREHRSQSVQRDPTTRRTRSRRFLVPRAETLQKKRTE
jgi:hypothetical protein